MPRICQASEVGRGSRGKLDELIRALEGADNSLVVAESETEEGQDRDIQRIKQLAQVAVGDDRGSKASRKPPKK